MKALLLKDFLTLSRMICILVALMLITACIPQLNMSVFFMVYCAMLPISAMAYDERIKWDIQAAMMPYRPWEIVLSKYVLGYIILAVMTVLALVAAIITGWITGSPLTADQCLTVLIYAMATTIFLAISLPLIFRFGVEKGRVAMAAGLAIAFAIFFSLVPLLNDNLDTITLTKGQIAAIVIAATATINLLSIRLSIHIYQRQRA